jgi:hypothetical protein
MMKRSELMYLWLALTLVFFACESDPGVAPERDPVKLALSEVNKNHQILVDAYKALSEAIPAEAIIQCRKAGGDRAEFMKLLFEKSNEAFEKVLVNHLGQEAAADYYLKIDGVEGEAMEKNMELLMAENSTDGFKNEVGKRLKEKSSSVDTWYIFKKLEMEGQADHMPSESFSLNFSKIEFSMDLADILLDLGLSDQERTKALEDAFITGQTSPVLIALLLPAVQKVREAAAKANEAEDMYLKWLEEEVIPTTSGGLDRDIIRRKCFFEYLGALDLVISQNYNNDNQLGASIAILKARFDFRLLSLWSDFWELEPAEG